MVSVLTNNEKTVLFGIVAYPKLNDSELSEKLDLPYSTLCTIRKRLHEKGYYRTINIPMLQRFGADVLAVIYTLFNPAISVEERAKITTKTIEVFEELFYSIGETHKGFSISISGDYGTIGRINDLRIGTFANEGLLDLKHPMEVIFPISISRIPRFFDFTPLLASSMNMNQPPITDSGIASNTEPVEISKTEKKVMAGLVEYPEANDKELSNKIGISRHTVSKSRRWLEKKGLIVKKRIPNLLKLGFNVMTLSHIKFNPRKPLDDGLLNSNILNNPATIFLAARQFECVMLSVYDDYEAYRADNTIRLQFLKENDYLAEMPTTLKYMLPNMVVMKDMIFGPITKKTLGIS